MTSKMANVTSCDFFDGTSLEVWIGEDAITCDSPSATQYRLSIAQRGVNGPLDSSSAGGSIAVPAAIADGRRLIMNNGQVIQFDNKTYPIDLATGIRFLPPGGITAGFLPLTPMIAPVLPDPVLTGSPSFPVVTFADYEKMLPLYSVTDVNYNLKWDTISFQNAGMNEELMARTTKKIAFSISGQKMKRDSALKLLQSCVDDPHKRVKILYISPDNMAREFLAHITSETADAKLKSPFEVKYDFEFAGLYKRYDLTPS
jgi:hypothetical protein